MLCLIQMIVHKHHYSIFQTPDVNPDLWKQVRVSAFWDRPNLIYEKWLTALLTGDARSNTMTELCKTLCLNYVLI